MPPSSSSRSLGLAGDLKFFGRRDTGSQTALISHASTPQSTLDPVLSKNLKFAVNSVSPRVVSVRKSFETVENAISNLKYSKNNPLISEWRGIVKDYKNVLVCSGELALHGAGQIEDFLQTIMPYLMEENEDITQKQEELDNYRKALKEGGSDARKFSVSLDEISERVSDFKEKWGDHTDDVVSNIKRTIEQLERDLSSLADSMQEVKKNIASITAQAEPNGEPSKAVIKHQQSSIKREIKEAKRESDRQIKSDKTVAKNADSINSKTDSLMVVWNLINDDINVIETQLKACVAGRSPTLFRQRVAKLHGQYQGLEESLRKYATALSFEPTDNSGRPFVIRVFSRLLTSK